MSKSARILSIGLLTGLSAVALAQAAHAQTTYSYTNAKSNRAYDFLNSLGVNLDMASPAPRFNVNAVVSDLQYTGFKHGRGTIGSFSNPSPNYYYTNTSWVMPPSFTSSGTPIPGGKPGNNPITSAQMVQMLASIGLRLDPILYLEDPAPRQSWLDANATYFDYIEGPNEVDLTPKSKTFEGLSQVEGGAAVQKKLYAMVKGDPKLSGIPVFNMTLGHAGYYTSSAANTGDLANYSDYGNIHPYAIKGAPPYPSLSWNMNVTTNTPGKLFIATETGYPTATHNATIAAATGTGTNIVNEDVQGKYLLDDVFDAFNLGIVKTYVYQLIDYQCDPYDTNAEMHFGIFRCDNSPKPAALGFHNFQTILQDQGSSAAAFSPAPLSFTLQESLTSPASDVGKFHTLLQKQNGIYELVLWGEPRLWDYDTHSEVTTGIPVNAVTVTLAHPYSTIKVFDTMAGTSPISQSSNTSQVKVSVSDHPIIIEISQ